MTTKSPFLSKTLWMNFILAASAIFLPAVHDWVVAHGDYMAYAVTAANFVLRFFTKDPLVVLS